MTKELPVAGGRLTTLVDDDVFEWAQRFTWGVRGARGEYVRRIEWKNGKRRGIALHREVMQAPAGLQVDHINRDTFDNRRTNLRLVTDAENKQNIVAPHPRASVGIRNVTKFKDGFRAQMQVNRREYRGPLRGTAEEAAADAAEMRQRLKTHAPAEDSSGLRHFPTVAIARVPDQH